MAITIAILSLLGALVPVVLWCLKRKHSPTVEESLGDIRSEYGRVLAEVGAARARGDDAGAESLLRRLRIGAQDDAEHQPSATGQCHSGNPTGGDGAGTTERQGG